MYSKGNRQVPENTCLFNRFKNPANLREQRGVGQTSEVVTKSPDSNRLLGTGGRPYRDSHHPARVLEPIGDVAWPISLHISL